MDKQRERDIAFMDRALFMAFNNLGISSPNPSVGALVCQGDQVISRGVTEEPGKRHAEVVALENAVDTCKGATMYVTLEPCSHYGKTPPCTRAIINAGIGRVVIPLLDPNPLVSGRGIQQLMDAGIEVVMLAERSSRAADLIRGFKKAISRELPFVIHKCAFTLDGRTATESGHSKWISSSSSRLFAHRLRCRADAVLVGKNTYQVDRPSLNARLDDFSTGDGEDLVHAGHGMTGYDNLFLHGLFQESFQCKRQPLRVVMGVPENITTDDPIFSDENVLVYARKDEYRNLDKKVPVKVLDVSRDQFPVEVCRDLYARGVMNLMVEGGSGIAGTFYDNGLVDHSLFIMAPIIAGSGIPVIRGRGLDSMDEAQRLFDLSWTQVAGDTLVSGYREVYNFEMR